MVSRIPWIALVAFGPEDRGPEDFAGVGVDDDLHEALRLALLDGAADLGHGAGPDQEPSVRGLRLGLAQAGAAQRRIGEEGVSRDAVADAAAFSVEQVGRDDLEVVVGGVGERPLAVTVAQRPDARRGRLQAFVDHDVAALVDLDTRRIQTKIIRVRTAAYSQQHVRSDDLRLTDLADDIDADIGASRLEADAFGAQPDLDALGFEDRLHRNRDVRVLAMDQPVGHLDHGDLGPEPPIDLGELESDVAPADDHQMARQLIELKQAGVGEDRRLIDTRQGGDVRAAADIDEDLFGGQDIVADLDLACRLEAGVPAVDRAVGRVPHQLLKAVALVAHDGVLPRLDPLHVDADVAAEHDTELGGPARQVSGVGAGHQGLGRRAAGVDAGAAEQLALGDRDLHPGPGQPDGEDRPRLARPDDDGVEVAAHAVSRRPKSASAASAGRPSPSRGDRPGVRRCVSGRQACWGSPTDREAQTRAWWSGRTP